MATDESATTTGRVYETIPIENAGQVGMMATAMLGMLLPTSLVVLRFIAQSRIRSLNGSDYCITAALFFLYGLCIADLVMVLKGGFTFHADEVVSRFGPDAMMAFYKCMAAYPLLWNCCVLTSKLSVLMMYTTLMPIRPMVLAARTVAGLVVLYNASGILTAFTICRPYAKNWDASLPGTCGDVKLYYICLSAVNVVSDVVIVLLPLPFVYNLQLALRKKLVLFCMFGIGFMTCVITIYRQTMLPGMDTADVTGSALLAFLFSTVEVAVAISMACIPLLRPLFKTGFGSGRRAGYRHHNSSGNGTIGSGTQPYFAKKGGAGAGGSGQQHHHHHHHHPRNAPRSSRDFDDLPDDSSEVQLQPVNPNQVVRITAEPGEAAVPTKRVTAWSPNLANVSIKVETKWEIESQEDAPSPPPPPHDIRLAGASRR